MRSPSRYKFGLLLVALARAITVCKGSNQHILGGFNGHSHAITAEEVIPEGDYIWENITPTKELVWHGCFKTRECARLLVPLNYTDESGEEAAIALIRVRSKLPVDSSEYRGPVLFNPGGPGGSGVDFIRGSGDRFAQILGPQFDIVGFDPRGIGRSIPTATPFQTGAEMVLWNQQMHIMDGTDDGVPRAWARAHIFGNLVHFGNLVQQHAMSYVKHINTENTARDMLRITEAHGFSKLQYWGFSYGSVLGSTFASILPDKVGRLVIDGIVDAENYFSTLWSNNLIDTHKTMQSFYDGCYEAGPEGCPFYAPSPKLIAQNLTSLYNSIRKKPIPVVTGTSYGIMDFVKLRSTVFSVLYSPFKFFHPLAQALADLANGNATALYKISETPTFKCACGHEPELTTTDFTQGFPFLACTDGEPIPSGLDYAKQQRQGLAESSEWGAMWFNIPLACSGWPQFPRTHFQGPFVANTSFPLLIVGNTADPVTPLWAAKKMSKGFTNSVVLTQDTAGHCSLSTPSLCTAQHIKSYFVNGSLPAAGTICEASRSPWPTLDRGLLSLQSTLSVEDRQLLDASAALSRFARIPRFF
ncbi:hypothetical protein BDN72DRAFT_844931 [Pluteus cervinus]|uniref:Uncharacterized protein n=1 Tax=Pluteus cervinus TaxID=181527 RepID=A0ACD3AK39_9AGAR|nr:hypothetical protein BDN72DRAFT_844931 [Pluteus cervinus]